MKIGILETDLAFELSDIGEEIICSRCKQDIPDEELPLFLFSDDGSHEYRFCHNCMEKMGFGPR